MHFNNNKQNLLAGLVLLLCSCVGTALATPLLYSDLYIFGDSLSDTGNLYRLTGHTQPVSPPYDNGRFSNGPVWVEDLADKLGLGAAPSLQGGHDFAFGGAQTGITVVNPSPTKLIDLPRQLNAFQSTVSQPQEDALYALWIGANDINAFLEDQPTPSSQDVADFINDAVGNIADSVSVLAQGGMQHLLALNVPDLSKTPLAIAATQNNPAALAGIQGLVSNFNSAFENTLLGLSQNEGFSLSLVDTFGALDDIVANPDNYGLSNVIDPCWTGDYTSPNSGQVCSNPQNHLFWDDLHPTEKGHEIIALKAYDALPVPEPNSTGLFLLGLVGILLLDTRRRFGAARA